MTQQRNWRSEILPPLWILSLLVCWVVINIAAELRETLSLLVIGYALAYIIHPALSFAQRKKLSRAVGFLLLSLVLVLLVIALAGTAIPTILRQYAVLAENLPGFLTKAQERIVPLLGSFGITPEVVDVRSLLGMLPVPSGETLGKVAQAFGSALLSGYSITLALLNITLLPFIVFYLAIDFDRLHRWALELFPVRHQATVREIAQEIDTAVAAFVRGQLLVGAILTGLYLVGLGAVARIELWFLLSVLSGFGNMIPYVGFLVGIVLSSVMALVTHGDLTHLLLVWAVYGGAQFLEGTVLTPRIVGENVGLSPLVVVLALLAGGTLAGLLGVFLAVPVAAALKVILRRLHQEVVLSQGAVGAKY